MTKNILALSQGETVPLETTGRDGEPATKAWWNTSARTKHVLAEYPPQHGWAIRVSAKDSEITLRHYADKVPTMLITASLVNREGVVVAEASVLQAITDHKVYEAGETAARGRLYDALGFPGDIEAALGKAIDPMPALAPAPGQAPSKGVLQVVRTTSPAPAAEQPPTATENEAGTGAMASSEPDPFDVAAKATAATVPEPPKARGRHKVTPVASRDFGDKTPASPQDEDPAPAGSRALPPTEGAASDRHVLSMATQLAVMRKRPPDEIAARTKTPAEAQAYLDELRGAGVRAAEGT